MALFRPPCTSPRESGTAFYRISAQTGGSPDWPRGTRIRPGSHQLPHTGWLPGECVSSPNNKSRRRGEPLRPGTVTRSMSLSTTRFPLRRLLLFRLILRPSILNPLFKPSLTNHIPRLAVKFRRILPFISFVIFLLDFFHHFGHLSLVDKPATPSRLYPTLPP